MLKAKRTTGKKKTVEMWQGRKTGLIYNPVITRDLKLNPTAFELPREYLWHQETEKIVKTKDYLKPGTRELKPEFEEIPLLRVTSGQF